MFKQLKREASSEAAATHLRSLSLRRALVSFSQQFLLEFFSLRLHQLWQGSLQCLLLLVVVGRAEDAIHPLAYVSVWLVVDPIHVRVVLRVCVLFEPFLRLLSPLSFEDSVQFDGLFPLLLPGL